MSPEGECFASTINSNASGSMRVHKSKMNVSLMSPANSNSVLSPGATSNGITMLTSPDSNNGQVTGSTISGINSSITSPMSITSLASGVTSPMSGVASSQTKTSNNNGSSGRSRRGAKAARKASRHYQVEIQIIKLTTKVTII